ncbi:ribonucleotide reductase stimulatory protein [Deinococcus rubellus]|uniref:Class Ib ribonucleoside-diphosphate reductase assembly flavoprotein NrdI n=1 Tax=Deinococcus rubellus TaxID=1889240 RepID=A0ABY5YG98_9DEIO|nr:class Ib ribonucleoside-diphosphate reductase assembly flavoprotein NrdI [Deinococcus rubellus]UWX64068.1 class Ib ribonucleoside-diphosphate reductase assembly flavoprotein NrdI [Deinococcus rubellus]
MQLVYDSLTGNVRRFAQDLARQLGGAPLFDVREAHTLPDEDYLLLTYTFGTGGVPVSTQAFMQQRAARLCGVVSSGSFHWGHNFARAADVIAGQYGVPVVAKVNKAGSAADRVRVLDWISEHRV